MTPYFMDKVEQKIEKSCFQNVNFKIPDLFS